MSKGLLVSLSKSAKSRPLLTKPVRRIISLFGGGESGLGVRIVDFAVTVTVSVSLATTTFCGIVDVGEAVVLLLFFGGGDGVDGGGGALVCASSS